MRVIILILLSGFAVNLLIAGIVFRDPLAWVLALAALTASIYLLRRWFRVHADHGRAGFAVGDALDISDPHKPQPLPNFVLPADYLGLGGLVLGSPKAGKTESYFIGFATQMREIWPGAGMAGFDGKGDIDIYKKYAAAGGPPDFFFSLELPHSHSLNLMDGEPADIVDRLTHSLIGHTESTTYYSDEQLARLFLVVPILKGLGKPVSLRDMFVALSVEDAEQDLLRQAKAAHVDPVALSLYQQWITSADHADRARELRGMLNRLFLFCHGAQNDRLNAYYPDIRVSDLVEQGKRIYFHLPLTRHAAAVAVAIVEMFHVEARRRQLAGPEHCQYYPLLFDDWGAFIHANFAPFTARCRSARMPAFFSFQGIAQLQAVSPVFAAELDDNLANKIVFRVMGERTGEYAQQLIGMYERVELGAMDRTGVDSVSLATRTVPRVQAQELKALRAGEAYISTVLDVDGETRHQVARARLPLADFSGWESVCLPTPPAPRFEGGLNFWPKYMDPAQFARLQAALAMDDGETGVPADPDRFKELA